MNDFPLSGSRVAPSLYSLRSLTVVFFSSMIHLAVPVKKNSPINVNIKIYQYLNICAHTHKHTQYSIAVQSSEGRGGGRGGGQEKRNLFTKSKRWHIMIHGVPRAFGRMIRLMHNSHIRTFADNRHFGLTGERPKLRRLGGL